MFWNISRCVGMADEGDSKSLVLITRVGSTPTTGIRSSLESNDSGLLFFLFRGSYTFCVLRENTDDCIGRRHLAGEIQMGINVAGCADVAMAQVVETDALHLVRYEDPDTLAWMYVSPIIVLLSVCDRQPEREAESLCKAGRP